MLRTAEDAKQPFLFRITPGNVKTVGRAPRADFVVDAALVSRLHCRLAAGAGEIEATDLKSTNGTYVNGAARRPRDAEGRRPAARRRGGAGGGQDNQRTGERVEPVRSTPRRLTIRRNGFVLRSRPIVVGSPWPE